MVDGVRRRKRLLAFVGLLLVVAIAAYYWYANVLQWQEKTDNAYVKGNTLTLSALVPGEIETLAFSAGDYVEAGEVVATLQRGDAERALEEAKNMLGLAVRRVLTSRAGVATAESRLELKATTHRLAQQEFERRRRLLKNRTVSEEEVEAAETRAEETLVELEIAKRELRQAKTEAGDGTLDSHPMVQVASQRLRDAVRVLNKHEIVAPVSGVLSERFAQVGQLLSPGQRIYGLVEADNFWVEANFKENQLENMRLGQPVMAYADVYGDHVTFEGTVARIGSGTGAEFAILPPQNATGNWIKIVQRVPVRIDVPALKEQARQLPLGASFTVTVNTRERGDVAIDRATNMGPVSANAVFPDHDEGAEATIAAVIAHYVEQASTL